MNSNFTPYLVVTILLFILYSIRKSIYAKDFFASGIKLLLSLCEILLFTIAIFYWRVTTSTTLTQFDALVTAIDIAFAQVFFTMLFFFASYYVVGSAVGILWFIIVIIAFIANHLLVYVFTLPTYGIVYLFTKSEEKAKKYSEAVYNPIQEIFMKLFLDKQFAQAMIGFIATFAIIKFFLFDTIDLQECLFGAYDGALGWNPPTTFRFTLLYNHVKDALLFLSSNEAIATIASFLGILIGGIIGIAGLVKAIKDISESFK